MAKVKIEYVCQSCGSVYPKWAGQCLGCEAWNTLTEETPVAAPQSDKHPVGYAGANTELTPLSDVTLEDKKRLGTGMAEFDHVLGGGLVSDSVVLIGGDPGVGKSTLLLQVMCKIAKNFKALYVTGEESLQQVAMRADRLDLPKEDVLLLAETQVERIISKAEKNVPQVMVIDSIQTIFTDAVSSAPGSVSQVRESAARLVRYAKQRGVALLIAGHVTKEGAIAGPRVLEHMVDTVLYFEGRNDSRYRVIRAVKNRFGAVNELGVFAMTDRGLKEVSNPSAIFLSQTGAPTPGSSIMVTWEGSRPLLVEVQALVAESHMPNPRRVTVGLDTNRLSMLLAVLHRHGQVPTYDQDVFVNVVGGLRIQETGVDLALLCAVLSSLRGRPMEAGLIVFGEVGLSGEIRPVPSGQERLREAAKHGIKAAIVPKANAPKVAPKGLQILTVEKLSDVISLI